MEQRRFAEALPYGEGALALHRQVGEPVEECHAHNVLGITKAYLGRGAEAEAHWRTGLPLADAAESAVAGLYTLANMTYLHFAWRGEYLAGIALLERPACSGRTWGRTPAAATELRFYIADLTYTLGPVRAGTFHGARICLQLVGQPAAQGIMCRPSSMPRTSHMYGRMLAEAGRLDEARQQLAAALPDDADRAADCQACDRAAPLGLRRAGPWRPQPDAGGDRADGEGALVRYGQAAAWNYDAAAAHRLLAELHLAFGDAARAVKHAQEALGRPRPPAVQHRTLPPHPRPRLARSGPADRGCGRDSRGLPTRAARRRPDAGS